MTEPVRQVDMERFYMLTRRLLESHPSVTGKQPEAKPKHGKKNFLANRPTAEGPAPKSKRGG